MFTQWHDNARVLRAMGHVRDAELIEKVLADVASAEPLRVVLDWLSESDACLKSGYRTDFFRSRFAEWQALGFAELRGKRRYYRRLIVPQRVHSSVIQSAARRAAAEGRRP